MAPHSEDQSGISVYPRLPVPSMKTGRSQSSQPSQPARRKPRDRRLIAMIAAAGIAGGTGAWFLQPAIAPDARISTATRQASDAELAAKAQKERADSLERSLDATAKVKREVEAKLAIAEVAQSELAGRTSAEAGERKATEAVHAQLKVAVDKLADAIAIDGREVHVRLGERLMFKPGDDALTDRGKVVLNKVAAALREFPDQLIWVQGHTDELPAAPPAVMPRPASPAKKPGKPAAPVVVPVPATRFATSWELSAARALTVVHYLQDVAKLEPTRLAALAFGPYAPVSKTDRAGNRRLEIVVAARRPSAE
jgi:chemotaxis protein MotB